VKAMAPKYVIVSAGKKPDTEVSHKYAQYCPNVWTTRWMGNIHLKMISGASTIFADRDA
jgi:beta-lactamase superfamily II metal-dependent hydrolase